MGLAPKAVPLELGRTWSRSTVMSPRQPAETRLRDAFFQLIPQLTLKIVRAGDRSLRLGPVTLLRFGEPFQVEGTWFREIQGGLLARRPGGYLGIGWQDGELFSTVEGYLPLLPRALWVWTQLPFHRWITRQFLLDLRGRLPAPGIPAEPPRRIAAAAVDLAACVAASRLLGRRHVVARAALIGVAYHLLGWTRGRTLGNLVTSTRVVAIDGSRVTLAQAALRLATLWVGARRMRTRHDEIAGTDVIRA